jgi:hypothetical protein
MSRSFRQILAESDIAAIAISILILWAVADEIRALGPVLTGAAYFMATAVAIRGVPSAPSWVEYGSGQLALPLRELFTSAWHGFYRTGDMVWLRYAVCVNAARKL